MNIFQSLGDVTHLLAFMLLLAKLIVHNSSAGVSGKTQMLFCLVFTSRYLDLFTNTYHNHTLYIIGFKCLFLGLSYGTTILIFTKYRKTYQKHLDSLIFEFLILWAMCLAYLYNYSFTFIELAWAFSEYLECVAVWPQFFMIAKTKTVSKMVFAYLSVLGLYRMLYISNWVYKYLTSNRLDLISSVPGTVQVVPFIIFWIVCLCKVVTITTDKTSWFGKNLIADQNGIFTIEVSEKGKEYQENLPISDAEPLEPLIEASGSGK